MKTMCPPDYNRNSFVATYALGHIMYGYTLLVPKNAQSKCALVHELPQTHCGDS